jgi:hypothetical protein
MTQSNDLPARMNRAEDNIIDLRLAASAMLQAIDKNSADIAQLIELSRYNLEVSRRNSESIATLDAVIRSNQAAIERMDRLLDYLIRRDQSQ